MALFCGRKCIGLVGVNLLKSFPRKLHVGSPKSTWTVRDTVFGKYLLITNTISSGLLMALGDLIQQQIEYVNHNQHAESYDWTRNKHMCYVGMFQGPICHFFYKILDRRLPGTAMRTIGKKIFFDQTMASPFCIVLFFTGMNFLNGESFQKSKTELRDKFLTVYAIETCFFPPLQFINFSYVPPQFRVLFISGIYLAYDVFLSYMKHDH